MNTDIRIESNRAGPNPFKLLWGTTWRGSLWLAGAGALLGVAYGLLTILAGILLSNPLANPSSAISGLFLYGCYSFVIGGLVGAVLGIVIGAIDGLALGLLTRKYSRPDINWNKYGRDARILSAALCPALALLLLVFYLGSAYFAWGANWSANAIIAALVGGFLLAVGLGGWWTGGRIADRYEGEYGSTWFAGG